MGPLWVVRALSLSVLLATCLAAEMETAAAETRSTADSLNHANFFHNPPPPAPYRFSPDYELYNFYMQHNSLPFYHHEMVYPEFSQEFHEPQQQSIDDIPPTSTFLELDTEMWTRTHGASRSETQDNAAAESHASTSATSAGGGATDDKSSVEDFSTLSELQQQSQESEAEDQDLFENNPRLDGMGHKAFNSYYGLPRFAEARAAAKVKGQAKHKAKQVAKFELQTWTYANTKEPPEWLVPPSMSPPGVPLTKPPPVPQMVPPPPPFPGYLDNHGPYSGAGSEAPVPPAYNLPRPPPSILPRWIPWSAYYVPTDK